MVTVQHVIPSVIIYLKFVSVILLFQLSYNTFTMVQSHSSPS